MDIAARVRLAYRAVLRRDADEGGLAAYVHALQNGRDMAWLVEALSGSDEFTRLEEPRAVSVLPPDPGFPLDSAPPMDVRTACDPAELQALWDDLARVWSGLGLADPYWSVLTEERYRQGHFDAISRAAFRESGEGEVRRLNAWLRRADWAFPPDAICVEYGCGVGRITRPLALQYGRVIGFDVSAPHLAEARAHMEAEGVGNVEFVLVRGPADLGRLAEIDLFYSVISLQHSPPPIIQDVLAHAFAALRPGGCAFFQVPTYASGYSYDPAAREGSSEMEMHVLPQRQILEMAYQAGLMVAETQPDWCVGRPGEWISTTFLLLRPG